MFLLNRHLIAFLFVATIVLPSCGIEKTATKKPEIAPLVEKINAYINACVERKLFNGSILVAKQGRILVNNGYGMADFEHAIPCTPQTKFNLASVTKQFTAMAIMILQKQGLLDINDMVSKHIPAAEFPLGKKITIHQCLTHTSGLLDYCCLSEYDYKVPLYTIDEIIKLFRDKPLDFEPGSKFSYSNSGYVLLGYIVEKISGQTFSEFLKENIFEPLGMQNTGFVYNSADETFAVGYTVGNKQVDYIDMSVANGDGNLISTTHDLYLWDQALYTEKLLPLECLQKIFTPFKNNHGYGWVIDEKFGHKRFRHSGGMPGTATIITRFVADDVCIIVLSNIDRPTAQTEKMSSDLAAIIFNQPYRAPWIVPTEIIVDASILSSYVGNYKLCDEEDLIISVTKESDKLFAQVTDGDNLQVFPESETKFFYKGENVQISFIKDQYGIITKLILHQHGEDFVAEKV
jgi:CubicO group peptidase (beta-lactamase class C family)